MHSAGEARLEELLVEESTVGLDTQTLGELRELETRYPGQDREGFARAAAAIHLVLIEEEPLPAAVRARLDGLAEEFWRSGGVRRKGEGTARLSEDGLSKPAAEVVSFPAATTDSPASRARLGWLAAAACLAVAVLGWWPRLLPTAPTPEQEQARLKTEAADLVSLPWSATEDPMARGASGEVVWSTERQTGFMRIQGLEANDPSVAQYQLWIFDRRRDERYPVDGGVFDFPPGSSEAIVRIDAKVAVGEPYLFAVTVEPPGGVVVSSRERIVLLAQA